MPVENDLPRTRRLRPHRGDKYHANFLHGRRHLSVLWRVTSNGWRVGAVFSNQLSVLRSRRLCRQSFSICSTKIPCKRSGFKTSSRKDRLPADRRWISLGSDARFLIACISASGSGELTTSVAFGLRARFIGAAYSGAQKMMGFPKAV